MVAKRICNKARQSVLEGTTRAMQRRTGRLRYPQLGLSIADPAQSRNECLAKVELEYEKQGMRPKCCTCLGDHVSSVFIDTAFCRLSITLIASKEPVASNPSHVPFDDHVANIKSPGCVST